MFDDSVRQSKPCNTNVLTSRTSKLSKNTKCIIHLPNEC